MAADDFFGPHQLDLIGALHFSSFACQAAAFDFGRAAQLKPHAAHQDGNEPPDLT